jgi:UDP-glucose:(heptosyl)LPS alpha-1,3-glucosyltransferase
LRYPERVAIPMKLALVRRGYSPTGGAEAYLKRFAAALASAGHEPALFTDAAWPAAEWPFALRAIGGGRSPAEFARRLAEARPRDTCDLVFSMERVEACDVYRAGDGVHAAWLERRARYEPRWRSFFRRFSRKHAALCALEKAMFRADGVRLVIANSELVKREILERYDYPAERICVIHNGAPPPPAPREQAAMREATRREFGLGADEYVLLFAGSGWERKGLRFAIDATNRATGCRPILLVAGHGRQRGLPASERVRFLGPVRGLARHLAAADAFILPTIYDPFSNACLEALAAGLPVITTRANGFAEILSEGEGSVVEQPDDIEALFRAIKQWACAERREEARPRLLEKGARFSVDENLRATLAAIEGLAS